MEQIEKKFYPPSASAGGENAHYLNGCDIVEHSPSYSSCLWKISEIQAGRINELHKCCAPAINDGRCKAVGMKQEEELKGQALYYFPRQFLMNRVITNLTPASEMPSVSRMKSKFVDVVHKAKPKDIHVDGGGFADAINAAIQETSDQAFKEAADEAFDIPIGSPTLPAQPSLVAESPLQYARRLAALRQ